MKKYYIAYGSNLNVKQMKFRCPTARIVGTSVIKREFDVKNIERTAEICYNENNHKLKNRKAVFYGTNSNFL